MWYLFLIIIVVLIAIYFFKEYFSDGEEESEKKWPYRKKNYLLSEAEKKFYFTLSEILKNDYLIFTKVRLCDLLYLPKYQGDWRYYWNKIQSKHVDFLICDREDIKPLLVIELDDSSHLKSRRIERDIFVDEALKDATLPILHIRNSYTYERQELLAKIKNLIL